MVDFKLQHVLLLITDLLIYIYLKSTLLLLLEIHGSISVSLQILCDMCVECNV